MNRVKAHLLMVALPWLFLSAAVAQQAAQPDPDTGCNAYTWDMTREFAAMKTPATLLAASADPKINPVRLEEGKHVTTTLLPQTSVKYVTPPERPSKGANPTGGLLFFKSGHAGRYRISLTSPHWIDVLDDGKAIEALAHEGRGGCQLLRKSVEFELPANRELVVQLSGADAATAGIVVTATAKE